ncbi:MAG TPA: methyl-accepting chemotaxis protein [Acidimicrobiia bacterium]|nr:methyl-accepting chemotaxis protein [Acidimicrobiia bacterium]
MKPTLRFKIVAGFLVAALAAVAVGIVGGNLVRSTHDNDERSAREGLQRVVVVSNAQVSLLMAEVFGSGLLIYGRNDSFTTSMVSATKATTSSLAELGHFDLSPRARALYTKLVQSHSSLVKLENNLFGLSLAVPDPSVPALKLEDMGSMQAIQTTIADTAEALRQQITKDTARARAQTTADADHRIQVLVWIVAFVGMAIVTFGVWFSDRLVRRVRTTAEILGRVAEGDLTHRFEDTGRDEVGEMATALNTTLDTVHDVICELESDADELSAFAEQASAQSATASAAANQIAGYVRTMRTATSGMADHADRLASLVELGDPIRPEHQPELAREIAEIAAQARRVADGLGERGLGRAADVSAVIVARNQAAADRLSEMAATLNAMIGMFVVQPVSESASPAAAATESVA